MDQKTHLVRMEQWAPIIKECCASGLSKRAWCMQNGIKVKQFYYWQRKLRDYSYDLAIAASSMTETPQPKFVELPGSVTSGAYNDSSDFIPSVIITSLLIFLSLYFHVHNGVVIFFSTVIYFPPNYIQTSFQKPSIAKQVTPATE